MNWEVNTPADFQPLARFDNSRGATTVTGSWSRYKVQAIGTFGFSEGERVEFQENQSKEKYSCQAQ